MEANPVNTVIHYWHYDPEFSESSGGPRVLPLEGPASFADLVRRYVGDIPAGALKAELCRSGVAAEVGANELKLIKRYYFPSDFEDDYIRKIAFSMRNLGNTLAHNANLVRRTGVSEELHTEHGRFERFAWSERLSPESIRSFQSWARLKGADFVENADAWIGRHEMPRDEWGNSPPKLAGVGVYFFVEE
jgi:hypothetical protein